MLHRQAIAPVGGRFDAANARPRNVAELHLTADQIHVRFDQLPILVVEQRDIHIPVFVEVLPKTQIIGPRTLRLQLRIGHDLEIHDGQFKKPFDDGGGTKSAAHRSTQTGGGPGLPVHSQARAEQILFDAADKLIAVIAKAGGHPQVLADLPFILQIRSDEKTFVLAEIFGAAGIVLKLHPAGEDVSFLRNPVRLHLCALTKGRIKTAALAELIAHQRTHKRRAQIH
ncbi:MAG: hypothetical protein BWY83_02342 [bacterium ADurb.Bin478]|nr:MAG: hypothetical protein BWY83_02342 [bacterium ADurb.Bin478]